MKDFLAISDYSPSQIQDILDLAIELKKEYFKKGNRKIFKGKVLGMIFQKPSLRTRVSFDMAMRHCGGDALYLSPNEIGLGKRESIADVARVLAGYVQALMARVFEHEHVLELAKWADVPVVNGLSDYNHPCQGMGDALTIIEKFGKRSKGLNVVFVGDGNNVAVSLMHVSAQLGWNFTLASPEGYDLNPRAVEVAEQIAKKTKSRLNFIRDPHEAVRGAHVLYTDTWTSMGQEAAADTREHIFPPYQVNAKLVGEADKDVIVMHCLPAHRNHELTDEVADGPHSVIFPQAHNRLHAQKAILARLFGVA
ncbi:MAG: ornithine carbamoyltransferase [Anaerolineae bacterium CFX3]|jgi:ornithine carbamoyltransferase|nr:ornithine carbamoyltransferase [Anaerolineae bacterium]MCE7906329.1 ornithine carbamoyltransferase [Anaerolineae bacterium CFX3]MCZ7550097.1 ornithine carbamoyltransferase [Anaerolineales bacterium]GER79981.1 ornithine carbamoyltransferase [Candidatus Denitrolinea symbiosum]MCQ3947077.1 ornithine carbamoyltransferase [Anaerolineae bacterium]